MDDMACFTTRRWRWKFGMFSHKLVISGDDDLYTDEGGHWLKVVKSEET